MKAVLLFPHQLFRDIPTGDAPIYLVEEQLLFGDVHYPAKFHKQKLVLHRASMQAYADALRKDGRDLHIVEYEKSKDLSPLFDRLKEDGIDEIEHYDPVDFMLEKRLRRDAEKHGIVLNLLETPSFLCTRKDYRDFFEGQKHYNQTSFYRMMREGRGILMDDGKPRGGKWTYDVDNRKKLPKDVDVPPLHVPKGNDYVAEAREWVEKHFPDNPGTMDDFIHPVTREDALKRLDTFLKQRLHLFGDYQDAMAEDEPYVFHALISSSLNIGLITPQDVVDAALKYTDKHDVHLNSLEGFLRQVVGWREYVRAMYDLEGVAQRTTNFWKHERPMPKAFYDGTTGIAPVDHVIGKVLKTGYAHHIERLMILGNFMLLCEIDPDDVYTWFMELFIDAYDWVMVPNVYAMSQFADGGRMMTKPYISSSNYVRKMSDYEKGEWCDIWDDLYWRFVAKNREFFEGNPRLKVMTSHLKRMGEAEVKKRTKRGDAFLERLS